MIFAILAVLGCSTVQPVNFAVCDLAPMPTPAAAFPGETVTLIGGPVSTDYDTVITIAGVPAIVSSIDREGCDLCDACRNDADCITCGACIQCDAFCEPCVETTIVTIAAEVPAGPTFISIVNTFGTGVVPFTISGEHTGQTGNTGSTGETGGDTSDTSDTSTTGDTGP